MRIRLVVACSLAAALTLPMSPVTAAPKKKKAPPKPPPPVCHLITDERGDGYVRAAPPLESPALDIIGADVASGKKTVVAVLRVATTDTALDPMAAFGMEWHVLFVVKDKWYDFGRRRLAGAEERYRHTFNGIPIAKPEQNVKETATEIRWTVPRSQVPALKSSKVFKTMSATSGWFAVNADSAGTSKTYNDMTPSCLKPA